MSGTDLIVDYYQRDLDTAEEEALGRLLEASPAEAERFAALAAADYRRFGLPEPGRGGRARLAWASGAILAIGLAGWAYWPEAPAPRPVLAVLEEAGSFEVVGDPTTPAPPRSVPRGMGGPGEAPSLLRVGILGPQGPFEVAVAAGLIGRGSVHDSAGRRVADLRRRDAARLQWDGRVDGRLARPGAYQLRVHVDGVELRQWVEIEVR